MPRTSAAPASPRWPRGGANRVYNINDDSALAMGEWFDLLADRFQLPRAPRLPREEVQRSVPAMQWSFMSESRRLDNTRMKRELRLRLRYPTVVAGIAAAKGKSHALVKSLSHPVRRQLVRRAFYLPRIFVNLAMVPAGSDAERERLLLMAGKLFRFMTPLGVLAVGLGLWLWFGYGLPAAGCTPRPRW
jgi:hypothetical protein